MKKILFLLMFLTLGQAIGQNVRYKTLRPKTLTTAQRDALSPGANDRWEIYNITTDQKERWTGLVWVAAMGGADNLGNHIATQDLEITGFELQSDSDLILKIDDDNNGANNLLIKNGSGATIVTITEGGNLTADRLFTASGEVAPASDTAYGPSWDSNLAAATKNAIYDKIETLGSGGTPGGSTNDVQYNNAGAFAGNSNFTYDPGIDALRITNSGSTSYIQSNGQNISYINNTLTDYTGNIITYSAGGSVQDFVIYDYNVGASEWIAFKHLTTSTYPIKFDFPNNFVDIASSNDDTPDKPLDVGNGLLQVAATGELTSGNYIFDSDQTVGAGQDNFVMTYDQGTNKISLEAANSGITGTIATDQIAFGSATANQVEGSDLFKLFGTSNLRLGEALSEVGIFDIYGGGTGTMIGGQVNCHLSDDYDGLTSYYSFGAYEGYFSIREDNTTDLITIDNNGTLAAPEFSNAEIDTQGADALLTKGYGDENYKREVVQYQVGAIGTDLAVGDNQGFFPFMFAGTIEEVHAELLVPGTTTGTTVDVELNGSTIFSTLLTIDATEEGSDTAATPAVLSTTSVSKYDRVNIDLDVVPTGGQVLIISFVIKKS